MKKKAPISVFILDDHPIIRMGLKQVIQQAENLSWVGDASNLKESLIKITVNMPKSYHRKLKAIAALKDIGLSTYIVECVEKVAFRKNDEKPDDENSLEDEALKEVEELIEAQLWISLNDSQE